MRAFTILAVEVCGTAGLTEATVVLPSGDRYYLVVPLDGADEGSYGTDGDGLERPVGVVTCGPQVLAPDCP